MNVSSGGEAFAALLNYMYSGHLEVSLDNIYAVLLATHLLHMPGALEQCRAALLRLRAPPTSNVLRPVPSRLLGPSCFGWPTTGQLYTPRHLDIPQLSTALPLTTSILPTSSNLLPKSSSPIVR